MSATERRATSSTRGDQSLDPSRIQTPHVDDDAGPSGIHLGTKRELEVVLASGWEDADDIEMMFGERIDLDDIAWSNTAYVDDASAKAVSMVTR